MIIIGEKNLNWIKMMINDLLPQTSTPKEIRKFAITMGIVLAIIAGFLFFKKSSNFRLITAISGFFFMVGLIRPTLLKPLFIFWMVLANIMSWIMTRIILGALFFIVFTSIGLISKIFGKQFLKRKWNPEIKSYWHYRDEKTKLPESYNHQF